MRQHLISWRRKEYRTKKQNLMILYAMSIFSTLHFVLPLYTNSNFMSSLVGENMTSTIYTISSVLTILGLLAMTQLLERYGNFLTTISVYILELISLFFLSTADNLAIIIAAFLGHLVAVTLIAFSFDVFLETFSDDSSTGSTRGTFLTFINIAFLIAPILGGFILDRGDFTTIYAIAFVFLIPTSLLLLTKFSSFKDTEYNHISFFPTLRKIIKNEKIKNIFWLHLLLKMFFAWMVIYTPLYLHEVGGLDYKTIGTMLTVMLSAYVLFELPIGKLEDKAKNEKSILFIGYLIIGLSTAALTFIAPSNILWWSIVLFITRIGAAMVEVSTESYFFKQIDNHDTDEISFFRMIRPVAYMIAPLFAAVFIAVINFQLLFLAIGIIMLSGIYFTLRLSTEKRWGIL